MYSHVQTLIGPRLLVLWLRQLLIVMMVGPHEVVAALSRTCCLNGSVFYEPAQGSQTESFC